jgi:inosine/xanthosine triphosphate pyrophosphatase family protein
MYPFFEAFVPDDVAAFCKADSVTAFTVRERFLADDTMLLCTDMDTFLGVGSSLWRGENSQDREEWKA